MPFTKMQLKCPQNISKIINTRTHTVHIQQQTGMILQVNKENIQKYSRRQSSIFIKEACIVCFYLKFSFSKLFCIIIFYSFSAYVVIINCNQQFNYVAQNLMQQWLVLISDFHTYICTSRVCVKIRKQKIKNKQNICIV